MLLFRVDRPTVMFLFCSHGVKQAKTTFSAALEAEWTQHGYRVTDAQGYTLAWVYSRDDLYDKNWSFAHEHLTSDEARRIASAVARLTSPACAI